MDPTLQAGYDLAVAAFRSNNFCDNGQATHAEDPVFACVNGLLYCVLVAITFAGGYWFLFSVFVLDHKTPGQQRQRSKAEEQQCLLLSTEQVDLVAKRRWKEALAWIVFHPDELQRLDRHGQSFLHHACLFRAPADVIQMILWRAPELAAKANPEGQVPLHWAVRLSVPNESLQALILAAPETACWAKDTLDGGHTPLSLLWDRHKDSILTSWWAHQNGMEDGNAISKLHSWKRILLCFPCRRRSESGQIIEYHTNTTNYDDNAEILETPLHVASRSPCPPGLYPFLLQVFSKDAMRRDAWGRLPLHVACSNAASNRSTDVSTKLQAWMRGTTADPRSACYTQDYQGRTPFHVALASGISWEEGIKDMVELDPEWMLHGPVTQDPVTLLEPFLLAATDAIDDETNNAAPLDTIFKLLRMDPTRIAAASYRS